MSPLDSSVKSAMFPFPGAIYCHWNAGKIRNQLRATDGNAKFLEFFLEKVYKQENCY